VVGMGLPDRPGTLLATMATKKACLYKYLAAQFLSFESAYSGIIVQFSRWIHSGNGANNDLGGQSRIKPKNSLVTPLKRWSISSEPSAVGHTWH
jgi:hypothetical protein